MSEIVGNVAAVWRFPVKSMRGEHLEEAELTAGGLVGDRAYALIDDETGRVVSAKSVRRFPDLLACRAEFVRAPRAGEEPPPARIVFPDGSSTSTDDADAEAILSRFFGRPVRIAAAAPADFTIDQYHPDVAGADPAGHRDTVVEQKLGAAFFADIGASSPVSPSAFFDLFPVSVLTTSTLDELNRNQPGSRFDARRFRMNLIVGTKQLGFPENDWIGCDVAVGEMARLQVAMPDPRCVMTTLAQDDLPQDVSILRALVEHNRVQIGETGSYPCAGVYAVAEAGGTVRTGDAVVVN